MQRARVLATGALAAAGVLGTGSALAESRSIPKIVSEQDIRNVITEKHGRDSRVYYDLAELPSLGEDGNCQGQVGPFYCFGIFDGHAGWATSQYVSQHILTYLKESFAKSQSSSFLSFFSKPKELDSAEVDEAIKNAFVKLDHDGILAGPLRALKSHNSDLASQTIPLAASGSCAMLAFYNPLKNLLKVALVGDSRTVLGVQDAKGVWHARNLTFDQTGETPSEISRIRAEHPNDSPEILKGGRILGFQPTRSFGDARTKYTRDEQEQLAKEFWWRRPNPLLKTPPYMTALPVISTVELDPHKPTFMVMGCDGLFEWLSNAQVVDLVGQWLEKNPAMTAHKYAGTVDESDDDSAKGFLRPQYMNWGPLKPVVKDENVSTHLIRNALGGSEFQKVSMLMSIPAPTSRAYRDDITCTVVFFTPAAPAKL